MRYLLLLVLIIPLSVLADDYSGHWVWDNNSDKQTFSLKIEPTDNGFYLAEYCAVGSSGARIDCSRKGRNSFKFRLNTPFTFKTNYSGGNGEATISTQDGKLVWRVTNLPKREHYAPITAILSRYK